MFYVLYRCVYREHWYNDVEPQENVFSAMALANQISAQRHVPAVVCNENNAVIYRVG